jgi:hypothetical protein
MTIKASVYSNAHLPELVAAVRAHALTHYEEDGWDYVVECWEDAYLLDAIGNARTLKGAVAKVRRHVKDLDEVRDDVRAA